MGITVAVLQQIALAVTAGGQSAVLDFQIPGRIGLIGRQLHPHPPGAHIGQAIGRQITAKANQNRHFRPPSPYRLLPGQCQSPVYRVFLADTAQIDFHARGHADAGITEGDAVPTDQRQQSRNRCRIGHTVAAVEPPGTAQNAGRDIEQPST